MNSKLIVLWKEKITFVIVLQKILMQIFTVLLKRAAAHKIIQFFRTLQRECIKWTQGSLPCFFLQAVHAVTDMLLHGYLILWE